MHPRLMNIPIVMLWTTAAGSAMKLIRWHLLLHDMMTPYVIQILLQWKLILTVAAVSSLTYEAFRLIEFIIFGDDRDG